jgi:N-acetylneuraminate synthase/N,N'-diacetyllegionaminate synthase
VAEIGVNHDGDVAIARQLIETAASCGADAVKFQAFRTEATVAPDGPLARYQEGTGSTTQTELLRRLELGPGAWGELAARAAAVGIAFMCTAFDEESLAVIDGLDPVAHKIPSGEITNLDFLRTVAQLGRPTILSTGMADLDEVRRAVEALEGVPSLAILHCVSAYPAPAQEANLRAILTLADEFGCAVGWSDHTEDSICGVAAVALGAQVIERHLTFDRSAPGPDHRASDDPERFGRYVAELRVTREALGDGVKRRMPSESDVARVARRSWHAAVDLPAGIALCVEHLRPLRPEDGIPVGTSLVGRRLCRPVRAGRPINSEDLEPEDGT